MSFIYNVCFAYYFTFVWFILQLAHKLFFAFLFVFICAVCGSAFRYAVFTTPIFLILNPLPYIFSVLCLQLSTPIFLILNPLPYIFSVLCLQLSTKPTLIYFFSTFLNLCLYFSLCFPALIFFHSVSVAQLFPPPNLYLCALYNHFSLSFYSLNLFS